MTDVEVLLPARLNEPFENWLKGRGLKMVRLPESLFADCDPPRDPDAPPSYVIWPIANCP